MTTLTDQTESRTLEQIEAQLANAEEAKRRIDSELAKLPANLEDAVKAEAEAVERAMRAGKAPKPNSEVARLEQRRVELGRQLEVAETLADKLLAELLVHVLKEAEAQQAEAAEAAEKALEEERRVTEVRVQRQSEFAWARERAVSTREALVAVRRRLAERGIEEATDLEERRKNAEQAEAHRRLVSQWHPTYPVMS
jgi:hypothetical protein